MQETEGQDDGRGDEANGASIRAVVAALWEQSE